MQKVLLKSVMAALAMLLSLNAQAHDVEIDGIYYNLDTKTKTAEVTSGDSKYTGNVAIPESIENNGVVYPVTSIGKSAFEQCSRLTSVSIPNGILSIKEDAFSGCSNLTSVKLPTGLNNLGRAAFNNCISLTSMNLPTTLVEIGSLCFSGCQNLRSDIIIPKGVETIGMYTFSNCERITKIVIPETVTEIGECAFYYCKELVDIEIPSSVNSIGDVAFSNCQKIKSITIPEGVKRIGTSFFYGCTNLKNVTLPQTITEIGRLAFMDCFNLTSISIPDHVISIEDHAFSRCSNLQKVNISPTSQLVTIQEMAFSGCSSLSSFYIPKGVNLINDDAFIGGDNLSNIEVHPQNEVYTTYNGALYHKDMKTIVLYPAAMEKEQYIVPNGVEKIGNYAFEGASIKKISLPTSLKTIGERAFYGSHLMYVTIPASVTEIGQYAFGLCDRLDAVMALGKIPADIYDNTFTDHTDIIIFVDEKNIGAYKNALYWKNQQWILGFPTAKLTEELLQPTTISIIDGSCEYGEKWPKIQYKAVGGHFEGEPMIVDYNDLNVSIAAGEWVVYIYKGSVNKKNLTLINGKMIVKKAHLTVGVQDVTITEGDDIPAFKLTYDGWKNNDSEATAFIVMPIVTTTATANSTPGTYDITVSGGSSTNYEVTYKKGTLTILKKEDTDAIEDVIANDGMYHIYTTNGTPVDALQKGMNILRNSNGTTKKVFVK